MNLLYIWVEEFRCFKNNEFNFNYKYKFNFNHKHNIMKISCNKYDTLSLFKDDKDVIQDITLVVGENGAGKTTLSELLFSKINLNGEGSRRIYILQDNAKILCYCSGRWNNTKVSISFNELSKKEQENIINLMDIKDEELDMDLLKNTSQYIKRGESINLTNYIHELDLWSNKNIDIVYDSNAFSYQSVLRNKNDIVGIDISLSNAYNNELYFNEEFMKQIQFIIKEKELVEKEIKFKLPDKIKLHICLDNIYSLSNKYINNINARNSVNNLVECLKDRRFNIKYILMFMLISDLNNFIYRGISLSKKNQEKDKRDKEEGRERFDSISIERILNMYNSNKKEYTVKEIENFIKSLYKEVFDFVNKENQTASKDEILFFKEKIMKSLSKLNLYRETNEEIIYTIDVSNRSNLNKFLEFYEMLIEYKVLISNMHFNWVMSTGENAFLNIFSKYYDFKKSNHIKNESLIIFIDEADLYLHPRWQQKYISLIIKYFNTIFKDKKVQLIITTHSPIILSDIPKNHIIYINKDGKKIITNDFEKHKETFGGNIFDIYNDSFFLSKDNNGEAIGSLADNTIKQCAEKLRNIKRCLNESSDSFHDDKYNFNGCSFEDDLRYCDCVINTLGEPVYKLALKSQYNWIKEGLAEKEKKKKNEALKKAIDNIEKMGLSLEEAEIIKNILERDKND